MTIHITTPVPLDSTPVFIGMPHEQIADSNLQLRRLNGGAPIPAQATANGLLALLTLPPGRSEFQLESAPMSSPQVSLQESDDQLKILLPGGPFGTYHFEKAAPRPYLWPLLGPGGKELTRAFPMENREGEKQDHPHHRSLWTAFDEVNEVNNWHEGEGHGWTRHQRFVSQMSGPVFGSFRSENYWTSAQGEPFMAETRTMRVYSVDGVRRLFDYEIAWHATHDTVTFGDTKEAGVVAFRVATSMDGARGGIITNSNGGRGEKECWGKQADWCDYSGEVDGETYGITVFNRPESDGEAPRWHVRDYGLFAANPFSVAAFEGGEKQPFVLQNRHSVHFFYRVLLHKGDAEKANLEVVWDTINTPPRVEITMQTA
ncbi:MAG TPA: PmoA family protein [Abditibacteriaceae bacterium]|jgi:hypothetical protein